MAAAACIRKMKPCDMLRVAEYRGLNIKDPTRSPLLFIRAETANTTPESKQQALYKDDASLLFVTLKYTTTLV